jgi:hypothetical protein
VTNCTRIWQADIQATSQMATPQKHAHNSKLGVNEKGPTPPLPRPELTRPSASKKAQEARQDAVVDNNGVDLTRRLTREQDNAIGKAHTDPKVESHEATSQGQKHGDLADLVQPQGAGALEDKHLALAPKASKLQAGNHGGRSWRGSLFGGKIWHSKQHACVLHKNNAG